MPDTLVRLIAALLALTMLAAACGDDGDGEDTTEPVANDTNDGDEAEDGDGDDSDDPGGDDGETDDGAGGDAAAGDVDPVALGLWDDGPCDEALDPLVVGIMTVFESPVLSLEDQALALEASAEAFNTRGGANGACVEVVTCDDGADFDQALACADEMEDSGVVATINDQGSTAQAEVSSAMADAGIPRIAGNVTNDDWADPNAFPIDPSGTGVTFVMPQALIEEDVSEIAVIRVDLPEAGAMVGLFEQVFADSATFPVDVGVPAGTTDYSQFIIASEDGGAGGAILAIGEQEAVQVIRAAEQLGTDLQIGASLGTFAHSNMEEFGSVAEQMVLASPFPPATADVEVYDVLRSDLASSGEEALQPLNLKTSPMRSWIGLYALLSILRDSGTTEFTGETITTALREAEDVPMLGIYGGTDWTPDTTSEGLWTRRGIPTWGVWRWDPEAEFEGTGGNFVVTADVNFDEILCGSVLGDPEC